MNILSTIKNEGKDKYLILRKKYINECPAEDNLSLLSLSQSDFANSPGSRSTISEHESSIGGTSATSFTAIDSPYREPPPYKPPPEVKVPVLATETKEQYKDCVDEFKYALSSFGIAQSSDDKQSVEVVKEVTENYPPPPVLPPRKRSNAEKISEQAFDEKSEENKENAAVEISAGSKNSSRTNTLEKQISVAEATKKFNRIASEEEAAKVTSPPTKKKPEKVSYFFSIFLWILMIYSVILSEQCKVFSRHFHMISDGKIQDDNLINSILLFLFSRSKSTVFLIVSPLDDLIFCSFKLLISLHHKSTH